MNDIEQAFPNLAVTGYKVTSPKSKEYNCIAWAADDPDRWWWPDRFGQRYWPARAPRQETLDAFVAAYAELGYFRCEGGEFEDGYEKVAIYLGLDGAPKHAAKQVSTGFWTSKLGEGEDIQHHTLDGLAGTKYGIVAQFLKRPVKPPRSKKAKTKRRRR